MPPLRLLLPTHSLPQSSESMLSVARRGTNTLLLRATRFLARKPVDGISGSSLASSSWLDASSYPVVSSADHGSLCVSVASSRRRHGMAAAQAQAQAQAQAASPPLKKARNTSPETSGSHGVRTAAAPQHRPHPSASNDKLQARRIKSKLKDRERSLAKTGEEPIFYDICDLLGQDVVGAILAQGSGAAYAEKFERGQEETLLIERLSAHGDGLAISSCRDWVVAVPHALPGETAVVRIYSNERLYSRADLVRIVDSPAGSSTSSFVARRDDLVGCKYFGTCSGCQYQNIEYDTQLRLKRTVVERAFGHFSHLRKDQLPKVLPTLPSPLQYSYRTKLTPHFELPRELRRGRHGKGPGPATNGYARSEEGRKDLPDVSIGFDKLGEKKVLDIEECPIATRAINRALPDERKRIKTTIDRFKNGATILLRDSLRSLDSKAEDRKAQDDGMNTESTSLASAEEAIVVTDHKASVQERVADTVFTSPAGAFFQNNRSILPALLTYVREQVATFSSANDVKTTGSVDSATSRYLVDAYCGSGLFSLCLAHMFTRVAGVEISQDSIKCAKENARLNAIDNVDFLAGDAMEIFKVGLPQEGEPKILLRL